MRHRVSQVSGRCKVGWDHPKTEIRKPKEIRNPKTEMGQPPWGRCFGVSGPIKGHALRISDFGFPSDFGFRASDLSPNAAWGHAAYRGAAGWKRENLRAALAKRSQLLRSPQHTLHPKLPRRLPLPFRRGDGRGEGLLRVVYPAVLAVGSV